MSKPQRGAIKPIQHSVWGPILCLVFMFGVGIIVSEGVEANRYNAPTKTLRLM